MDDDATRATLGAATHSTVASLVRGRARVHPNRRALVDAGRISTYGELDARTDRLAAALSARGVQHGDRIAVLSENRAEYLEVIVASRSSPARPGWSVTSSRNSTTR